MSDVPVWLANLNDQQAHAVTHGSDPLLILAGAGSGKTRVITSRIAWMVAEKGFNPASILAVTFSNRAAAEMRERVTAMAPQAQNAVIRTFHSFGAWLLRRNAGSAGLSPQFSIYDDDDQVTLLSQLFDRHPRKELRRWVHLIARAKDEGLSPDDDLTELDADSSFPGIYHRYEHRLREIGNVDFGDLILLPIRMMREHPEIRQRLRQRFQAVLVDEYQDTNVAQYHFLKELVGPDTWMGVVGDDDQSIYGFRGAKVGNILGFASMFPGAHVVKLEQNYRSTGTILSIASAVVSHNQGRLGKTLWTAGGKGSKAVEAYLDDQDAEAQWCAEQIDSHGNYGGTAILYRTNAQSRVFEMVFRRWGIPYRIVGTLSFYQREEVKDVLAYLSWLVNPRDEVAFRRIANKPTRGLGKTSVNLLVEQARHSHSGNILDACAASLLKGKAAKAAEFLVNLNRRCMDGKDLEHLGFLVRDLLMATELLDHYREIDRLESSQRTANLNELMNAAAPYPATPEGLVAFLELVELDQVLVEEEETDENRVTLITMHNTKGLEFDHVIITGMEEGLFPRDADDSEDELEEERRLFYVAITRARKELAFTTCRRRMLWGRYRDGVPSRFLREIPPSCIRVEGDEAAESDQHWSPGTRLHHEDYGVGVVQKRLANRGHTVIHVLFESGRSAIFLPEFSSNKLEYLGAVDEYLS